MPNCKIDTIWIELTKEVEQKGHTLSELGVPVLTQLFKERVKDWMGKQSDNKFPFNPSDLWFQVYVETMTKTKNTDSTKQTMRKSKILGWIKSKLK